MATRRAGETLEALAANPSGEWLQVRVPGQGRGWVSAAYAVARGDLGALAVGPYQPGLIIAGAGAVAATPSLTTATPAWPLPSTAAPAYTPPGATPTPPPPPNGPPPTQTPPAVWWPTPTATLLPAPTARR